MLLRTGSGHGHLPKRTSPRRGKFSFWLHSAPNKRLVTQRHPEVDRVPKPYPQAVVDSVMHPFAEIDVPPALRANIEKQGQGLLSLASNLMQSGMSEEQVRSVVDKAFASYRDELVAAILALRT